MARSKWFIGAAFVVAAVIGTGAPAWAGVQSSALSGAHTVIVASGSGSESAAAIDPADPPQLNPADPPALEHPLDPPVPAPAADAGSGQAAAPRSSAPNADTDTGTNADTDVASVFGQVTSDYNGGKPTDGITVTLYQFAPDGSVSYSVSDVTHQILTSNSIGSFAIDNVPVGSYWVLFTDPTDPNHPTSQWYGSTIAAPEGTQIDVTAPATGFDYNVVKTGDVTGTVSCVGCTAPLDPSTVDVLLATYDSSTNTAEPVLHEHPEADGTYAFGSLQPALYIVIAIYSGTGPYSHQSNSDSFQLATQATTTADILVAHLITPLSGVQPKYNSVVNALYFDFLNRLPSPEEASGWANLLQNLHVPRSAVSEGFVTSDEYRLIRIDAAYQNILGRAPDDAGRAGWLENMKAGRITTDDIETSLYASQEYSDAHGGTNSSFAAALYTALLHRPGSQSDWDFWGQLAEQNGRDWVIQQFWDEPETISERVTIMYETYLGRAPDAGGLQGWVNVALAIGDSGLRAGLTGSDEYFLRSQNRFQES